MFRTIVKNLILRRPAIVMVLAVCAALAQPYYSEIPVAAAATDDDAVVVPRDWGLIPAGAKAGDTFRLLFVTAGKRDASSQDIADYNRFIRDEARSGHADVRVYGDFFRVLGSTLKIAARDNTRTNPEVDGDGEPIYWLNGPKIADDYADFYDGDWDHADPGRTPDGSEVDFHENQHIFTGTKDDGSLAANPLGGIDKSDFLVEVARPGANQVIESDSVVDRGLKRHFYGLSGAFQVGDFGKIPVGLEWAIDRQLTEGSGGRDWYSFPATAGVGYIIELKNAMTFIGVDEEDGGGGPQHVPGHLVDPSILEVVDGQGNQVLGEHDDGGFTANYARAFFTPEEDGQYRIAVGAGAQDRTALGYYTLSVRVDDHSDDFRTNPAVVMTPGDSVTAMIDTDVAPDDPELNPWEWAFWDGMMRPRRGIESLDDRDVFRYVIASAGIYRLSVNGGPQGVGIWSIWDRTGESFTYPRNAPAASITRVHEPGTYYVEVGTAYESSGNTGSYSVSLAAVVDDPESAGSAEGEGSH